MSRKPHSIELTLSSSALNHQEYPVMPAEHKDKALEVRAYAMARIRDMNGWS